MRDIPPDSPHGVRRAIWKLYSLSAQERAQGCVDLRGIARGVMNRATTSPDAGLAEMHQRMAPVVPFLIPLLADKAMAWSPSPLIPVVGAPIRTEAEDTLRLIGGKPALDALAAAMTNRSPDVRAGAAVCLGGIKDPRSAELLNAAIQDSDGLVRVRAAMGLWLVTSDKAKALPVLVSLSGGKDWTASCAISCIGEMGPAAVDAVPMLIPILRAGPHRYDAARTLGKIGPAATAAVPALWDALRTGDEVLQIAAALALGEMGRVAESAIPDIIEVQNKSAYIRCELENHRVIEKIQEAPK